MVFRAFGFAISLFIASSQIVGTCEAQASKVRDLFSRISAATADPANPALRGRRMVQLDGRAVADLRNQKKIRLNLPGGKHEFRAAKRNDKHNKRSALSGGFNRNRGDALAVFDGDKVESISIYDHARSRSWTLLRGDAGFTLDEFDTNQFGTCGDGPHADAESDTSGDSATGSAPIAADGSITIDVMVVWSPEARAAAGSTAAMESLAQAAVASANQAYANSQVFQQLNLVYTGEVSSSESSDFGTNLTWLYSNGDGKWDEVHSIRNQVGADLVAVIVENGGLCGQAFLKNAFSAINRGCSVGNRSFAHELGHNMGSMHDLANAGGSGAYSYSYGWRFVGQSGGQFRTVMAYSPGTRIGFFSNPEVLYDGTPTGTSGANNALSLNNYAPTVANFRSGPAGACAASAPTATFSPSSKSGAAGSTQVYTVTITNRDSSSCLPSTFSLGSIVPAGWSATLQSVTVTVGPGSSASTTLNVTSPADSLPGTFGLGVQVTDAQLGSHTASANGAYVILAPDTSAPTAPLSLTASVKRRQVAVKWQAASDNVAVVRYLVSRDGAQITQTTSLSFTDRGVTAGRSYTYTVRAQDAAGNISAASNAVTVTAR